MPASAGDGLERLQRLHPEHEFWLGKAKDGSELLCGGCFYKQFPEMQPTCNASHAACEWLCCGCVTCSE